MTAKAAATVKSEASAFSSILGPRGLPLLGNAHQIRPDSFHQQLEAWEREYGQRFTFSIASRRFLAVSHPEVIGTTLRQRPDVFRRGARLVQVSKDLGFYGLFTANDETWRRQRPMVLASLDPSHIRTFLPAIADVTSRLKNRWERAALADESIDLLADLMRYTVDVTTSLAFGTNLNTLEQGDDTAIQTHLNVIFPTLAKRVFAPVDIAHWVKDKKVGKHVDALLVAVQKFISQAEEQLANQPALRVKPRNLIQALIAAKDREGSGITNEEVSGNVLTMLLAGEDTTASTLAWMIWLLFLNPEVLRDAQEEVDESISMGGVATSIEVLAALEQVEACAHEAMRLKPVAPIIILEAAQDVVVAGVAVPKGAFVVCLMRPAGLDPARFDEPDQFAPSRWLADREGTKAASSAKRVSMPFGAGPRICPGRYLALTEIKILAAMLLSNFEIVDVGVAGGGEPAERLSLVMAPVGLRMKLRLRDSMKRCEDVA